jgi:hypothetical protein
MPRKIPGNLSLDPPLVNTGQWRGTASINLGKLDMAGKVFEKVLYFRPNSSSKIETNY